MRLTEKEILRSLRNIGDRCAPLVVNRFIEEVSLPERYRVDALIEFSIQDGPTFEALVEIAPVPTPENILKKARQFADYSSNARKTNRIQLVVAPYIGVKQSKILTDRGISWIDLSGNMSIRVSNQIYIERTGKPNRFPDTAPIKKIFQGTSSLVSRALLLKPDGFKSVNAIYDFINKRNANITLSTISKVLKSLEEELLIDKNKSLISVPDSEKLLERLVEGYQNSTERKRRNTYRVVINGIERLSYGSSIAIRAACKDYVAYGFYAAQLKGLSVTDKILIFVKDIEQFRRKAQEELVSITSDAEFGNAIITETSDPGVWFNPDSQMMNLVVNDIELYLEMMIDTPRGPKIAERLRQRILKKGDNDGPKDN